MNEFNSPLSLSNYKSIIALGLILIIVAIIALVLYPSFQDLQISRQRVEEKKREIEREKEYLASLTRTKNNLANYQDQVDLIEAALPDNPSIPSLLNYINKISSPLRLQEIDGFETFPSESFSGLEETVISLKFSGSYNGLKSFISNIEKSSRLIKVESIYFSNEDAQDTFSSELDLKVYSYIKN